MAPVVSDPTDRRLRAARPAAAEIPADAADRPEAAALLASARTRMPAHTVAPPRRGARWALRAAAVGALAAGVAVAGLQPGGDGGPQSALARSIAMAVTWFSPPEGTVLHIRSTLRSGSSTAIQEEWRAVDDARRVRLATEQDGLRAETGPDGIYDPARDTLYLQAAAPPATPAERKRELGRAVEAKLRAARAAGVSEEKLAAIRRSAAEADLEPEPAPAAPALDPMIEKVRTLLARGTARLAGRERHAGVDAYAIEMPHVEGTTATWTLWVAADDGRPLELRIANPAQDTYETTTWETYEVLPGSAADQVIDLRAAHPGARVVRDAGAYDAAMRRLYPNG